MLHAQCFGNSRKSFELDKVRVGKHFLDLLAVLNVNILRTVFLVVVNGEAITRLRAFAAGRRHCRTYLHIAQRPERIIIGNHLAVTSHDNLRKFLNDNFFHTLCLFA